jgi:hypothetical protein
VTLKLLVVFEGVANASAAGEVRAARADTRRCSCLAREGGELSRGWSTTVPVHGRCLVCSGGPPGDAAVAGRDVAGALNPTLARADCTARCPADRPPGLAATLNDDAMVVPLPLPLTLALPAATPPPTALPCARASVRSQCKQDVGLRVAC